MLPVGLEGLARISPSSRPVHAIEQGRGRLKMRLGPDGQIDGHEIEGQQDIAIGGIARCGERDPVTRLEGGEKTEHEGAGGARRHHHPPRIQIEAVAMAVMRRDRGAQGRDAERLGIAETDGI